MILPDNIIEKGISLKDQFFDLKGLSLYSALSVPTLRSYVKKGNLPCFKVEGKILVKMSEFDRWLEFHRMNRKKDINAIADEVLEDLRKQKSDR